MVQSVAEEEILALPVDELALRLLCGPFATTSDLNRWNLTRQWNSEYAQSPRKREVMERLVEAYDWLTMGGLVAIDPDKGDQWAYVTERGRRARDEGSAARQRLKAEARLALDLHPRLEQKVRRQFLLGEWEIAAFAAFKEVEVRVRTLCAADNSRLGVPLMREAFRSSGGPLADAKAEKGEQVAMMDLFAGALGLFKNPVSHRVVDYANPTEAAEVVLLADLLMRLLDSVEGVPR